MPNISLEIPERYAIMLIQEDIVSISDSMCAEVHEIMV